MNNMHRGGDPASRILQVLRFRPRGMTITEVVKKTGIKRNSASKYLEMLRISGKVDCQVVGPAKLFSIAQRVPLSAFLCFSSNFIVVLNDNNRIIQVNDKFLDYARLKKDDAIGKTITEASLPIVSSPDFLAFIAESGGEQATIDLHCQEKGRDADYQVQVIPTVLEDGSCGCTIVLDDVTLSRQYLRNMEFLAQTAMDFVNLPAESNIYQYISDRVCELVPGAKVDVNAYDEIGEYFYIGAISDKNFHEALNRILGQDPLGMEVPITEILSGPYKEKVLSAKKGGSIEFLLADGPGTDSLSFYDLCFQKFPRNRCDEVVRDQSIGKVNIYLLFWKDELFGAVAIFLGQDDKIDNVQTVESFIRQASIAIRQRVTEKRLRKSMDISMEMANVYPYPISVIDKSGRYRFVNRAFTEMFGYSLEDVPNGREWFKIAYPDSEYRRVAIETWENDLEKSQTGEFRPRTFRVRCRNGEEKEILFQPVTLSGGLQFVVYREVPGTD